VIIAVEGGNKGNNICMGTLHGEHEKTGLLRKIVYVYFARRKN
jgi:hypothetical protein